ncbi:MAG: hypothetical protein L0387_23295, partial [Acidobacteria bacterium]|nr:hypothetical protein [Acidobacteriota bacterium]
GSFVGVFRAARRMDVNLMQDGAREWRKARQSWLPMPESVVLVATIDALSASIVDETALKLTSMRAAAPRSMKTFPLNKD